MAQEDVDRILELARGDRRVKTPAGAKQFGQPIGSVIRADIRAPGARMGAAAQGASARRLSAGGRDRAVPSGEAGVKALEESPAGTKISSSWHGTLTKQGSGKWDSKDSGKGFTSAELVSLQKWEGVKFNFGAAEGRGLGEPTAPRPSLAVGRASDARLARAEQQRIRAQAESEMQHPPAEAFPVGSSVLLESGSEYEKVGSNKWQNISSARGSVASDEAVDGMLAQPNAQVSTPKAGTSKGEPPKSLREVLGREVVEHKAKPASPLEKAKAAERDVENESAAAYQKFQETRTAADLEAYHQTRNRAAAARNATKDIEDEISGKGKEDESSGGEWIENADITYKGRNYKVLKVMPESRRNTAGQPDPKGSMVRVTVKDPSIEKPFTMTLPISVVQKNKKKTALSAVDLDETEVLLLTHDDGEVHEEDVVAYSHYLSVARDMGYAIE